LSEWPSKLHEYFVAQQPFVVATVVSFAGSSPESVGGCIFYSEHRTDRFVNSDSRFSQLLQSAKEILHQPLCYHIKQLPLNKIAGVENGHCEVFFEYFDAREYPSWMTQLRGNQQQGISCVLLREFDQTDNTAEIRTDVIKNSAAERNKKVTEFMQQENAVDCITDKRESSVLLLRALRNQELSLTIIGDHPVVDEITKQVTPLPVRLSTINQTLSATQIEQITENSFVVILTRDHELDYQYCETILKNSRAGFIGCIGSEMKAELFRTRLRQDKLTEEQLARFHMPIGLAQISGKQSAVVAASIVAQIMSLHHW